MKAKVGIFCALVIGFKLQGSAHYEDFAKNKADFDHRLATYDLYYLFALKKTPNDPDPNPDKDDLLIELYTKLWKWQPRKYAAELKGEIQNIRAIIAQAFYVLYDDTARAKYKELRRAGQGNDIAFQIATSLIDQKKLQEDEIAKLANQGFKILESFRGKSPTEQKVACGSVSDRSKFFEQAAGQQRPPSGSIAGKIQQVVQKPASVLPQPKKPLTCPPAKKPTEQKQEQAAAVEVDSTQLELLHQALVNLAGSVQ